MFIVALFIIAKTWKKSKVHWQMNGERRCGNTYTMEYYSTVKKDGIIPFAGTRMDLEIIILSEVNLDSERQIPYHVAYM